MEEKRREERKKGNLEHAGEENLCSCGSGALRRTPEDWCVFLESNTEVNSKAGKAIWKGCQDARRGCQGETQYLGSEIWASQWMSQRRDGLTQAWLGGGHWSGSQLRQMTFSDQTLP